MHLNYSEIPGWPPLAWLARCPVGGGVVEVLHGAGVETRDAWFSEAVWDGDFDAGDFDLTDVVFGSGARLRDGELVFVSSASTLDRLQYLSGPDHVLVSNSLPCLLAMGRVRLDPYYRGYYRDLGSAVRGLRHYERTLETLDGPVGLAYYHNLVWDGRRLREVDKALRKRDLSSYAAYRAFLDEALSAVAANMRDLGRRWGFEMLGTVSSGYDSPAIAAVARAHGLRQVITFERSRSGHADSGREIGELLGLEVIAVDRDAWRSVPWAEIPFIAGDAEGEEAHFRGAEDLLRGRVLLTGFHGDAMWSKRSRRTPINTDIIRTYRSGLSLTEYRLWAGFIHFPVSFLGVRQMPELKAISRSREMAPWDLTEAWYNRPIPRRILEEAGVPRGLFGQEKKASCVTYQNSRFFWTAPFAADYVGWLKGRETSWFWRRRLPPTVERAFLAPFKKLAFVATRGLRSRLGKDAVKQHEWLRAIRRFGDREHLFMFIFPWVTDRAKQRYALAADHDAGGEPALAMMKAERS